MTHRAYFPKVHCVIDAYNDVAVGSLTVDEDYVPFAAVIHHEPIDITATSKRDPLDKRNDEVAYWLVLSRLLETAAKKARKRADGLIKQQDTLRAAKEAKKNEPPKTFEDLNLRGRIVARDKALESDSVPATFQDLSNSTVADAPTPVATQESTGTILQGQIHLPENILPAKITKKRFGRGNLKI